MNKNRFKIIIGIFELIIFLFISLNLIYANDKNISLELFSNKLIYQNGENVNLSLKITNKNNFSIKGQIKGKVIIGDIGYEIQCFDYNSPKNKTQYLALTPLPASFSNSNRKTMTTLYLCSGTQMQSSKTIIDNKIINKKSGKENFIIGPFKYSYSINGTDYEEKSNKLNITIIQNKNNKQNSQNNQQNKNHQNQQQQNNNNNNNNNNNQEKQNNGNKQNSQKNQQNNNNNNKQNSPNSPNSQNLNNQNQQQKNQNSLSKKNQQSLTNSQKNSQSISQLKKQIANSQNPINKIIKQDNSNSFWLDFFIIFFILLFFVLIYYKFFNKKDEIITKKIIEKKPEIPRFIQLLNYVNKTNNEKEKAKFLSQSIRNYISFKNKLTEDLNYNKAKELTENKLFLDLLDKTEKIEFSGKKINLDYLSIIKKLKNEFK